MFVWPDKRMLNLDGQDALNTPEYSCMPSCGGLTRELSKGQMSEAYSICCPQKTGRLMI